MAIRRAASASVQTRKTASARRARPSAVARTAVNRGTKVNQRKVASRKRVSTR